MQQVRVNSLIVLFCFFGISGVLRAQQKHIKFDHFSNHYGAPQSYINVIHQDQTGFMWFGTTTGLVKYDGYDFAYYTHDPNNVNSLSSNTILSLCEDTRNGSLWIGLQNIVLDRFDLRLETFSSYQINTSLPIPKHIFPTDYARTMLWKWNRNSQKSSPNLIKSNRTGKKIRSQEDENFET